MTRSQLKQIIVEAVKKSLKKSKIEKTSVSYITSSQGETPTLYINIKVEAEDLDKAEKLRVSILNTLEETYEIKSPKEP